MVVVLELVAGLKGEVEETTYGFIICLKSSPDSIGCLFDKDTFFFKF